MPRHANVVNIPILVLAVDDRARTAVYLATMKKPAKLPHPPAKDYKRGWYDPVKMRIALYDAIKILATAKSTENYRVRMDRATYCLATFQPNDFPQRIRNRARMVLSARRRVAVEYPTDTLFHFEWLSPKERAALLEDLMALYEAVLIDIGRIEDNDYLYPDDRFPEKPIEDEHSEW